jgi:3-oxoadipate enol-lactonase
MLGYEAIGAGPIKALVLHDWLTDHTEYRPILSLLDQDRFTWVFPDLRGYGLSRHLPGAFTLAEACGDLVKLADHLGFARFSVIGHSMTGMIMLRLALDLGGRVERVFGAAPVSAAGLKLNADQRAFFENAATDDSVCREVVATVTGNRYGPTWLQRKVRRSRETSTAEARLGYLRNMQLSSDFLDATEGLATPMLLLAGENDAAGFREEDLRAGFGTYRAAQFQRIGEAGHYPMEETPIRYVSLLQTFLSAEIGPPSR